MEIITWGTRGSIAISDPNSVRYGGNTTCLEIKSHCLPNGIKLFLDAGSGLVPAAHSYLGEFSNGEKQGYYLLFTHYHWDHILGLTLAPPTFIEQIQMNIFGPIDKRTGPEEMITGLFQRPFFPVDDKRFKHKMKFKALKDFDVHLLAIHPEGGIVSFSLDRFNKLKEKDSYLPMSPKKAFPISECLIVKMQRTNHANANCISYRLEENPTGKVFVFCTDHEDVAGISVDFRNHLQNADLLIIDAQYSSPEYVTKAGFGHGTPKGCVEHAVACNVKRMGLIHHDPNSDDKTLENVILTEAHSALDEIKKQKDFLERYGVGKIRINKKDIFLCADYHQYRC